MAAARACASGGKRDGRLLRVRLARPKANVLDAAMIAALDEAFADAARPSRGAPALRGVLLDAEGPHFCFGASVEEHLPEKCARDARRLPRASCCGMLESPVPVLVAVRGQCLGGGLELALRGRPGLRRAGREARAAGDVARRVRAGRVLPAAGADRPGAPPRSCSCPAAAIDADGGAAARARERASPTTPRLPRSPGSTSTCAEERVLARAMRCGRRARGLVERVRAKLAALEELYARELMSTHDAVEGLDAFLEKRPARWQDR